MNKDLLRFTTRMMLALVFSLLFVLSSVTAVLSVTLDTEGETPPTCTRTCTVTGASVKSASNVSSSYEFTGSCTYTPSAEDVACPPTKKLIGTGTWTPDSACPNAGTAGTATEEIHTVGASPGASTTSTCPKNPWLNDNVQCSPPVLSAAHLTSGQRQALKQQEQNFHIIITPKPKLIAPGNGSSFLVPLTIPVKVRYESCFGNLGVGFQWRKSTNESWHDENISVQYTTSNNVATGNVNIDKAGFWRFSACLVASCSDWWGFQTILEGPPLPASELKAKVKNDHEIVLTWKASSNPGDGYKIERRKWGESYKEVTMAGVQATDYTDTGLSPATTYFYRVRTSNSFGSSPYSNEAQAKTLPPPIYIGDQSPKKPSNLTASAVSRTKINLSWKVSLQEVGSTVESFVIERKKQGDASFSLLTTVPPNATIIGGSNTYTDTGLLYGTTYFYRVKSHNSTGDSLYSNEAQATTLPKDIKPSTSPAGKVEMKKFPSN